MSLPFSSPVFLSCSNHKLSLNLKCTTDRDKIVEYIFAKTISEHNNNNEMATNNFGREYNNGKRIYEL